MSEHFSNHSYEHNDDEPSRDSFDQFDLSTLVSKEEHAQIRDQVARVHAERDGVKAEQSRQALHDVHKLFEHPQVPAPRTVLFEGKQEQVIDSYVDARGNEWVELADGRQTMKHVEIAPAPAKEQGMVADVEQLKGFDFTKPEAATESKHAEAATEPDAAVIAAEAHLEEVVRAKALPEEAAINTGEKAIEEVAESKDKYELPGEEARHLLDRLTKLTEEYEQNRHVTTKYLEQVIPELHKVTRGLNRTGYDDIGPELFSYIEQSTQEGMRLMQSLMTIESRKQDAIKEARQRISRAGADVLTNKKAAVEAINQIDDMRGLEELKQAYFILQRADPRAYKNDKAGLIRQVSKAMNILDRIQLANRNDTRFAQTIAAIE